MKYVNSARFVKKMQHLRPPFNKFLADTENFCSRWVGGRESGRFAADLNFGSPHLQSDRLIF